MKRIFEVLFVTLSFFVIIYLLLYFLYFNSLCTSFSGENEINKREAIVKLASCKDSIVCRPINISTNNRGGLDSWNCEKKQSILIRMIDNLKNSIIN